MLQENLRNEQREKNHHNKIFARYPYQKASNFNFYEGIDVYFPKGKEYSSAEDGFEDKATLYVPLNFDTEFNDLNSQMLTAGAHCPINLGRDLVSKQYSSYSNSENGLIYSSEERHRHYHSIGEWGEIVGAELEDNPNKVKYTETIVFVVISHFQTAELLFFFNGQAQDVWRLNYLSNSSKVDAGKRVQVGSITNKKGDKTPLPYVRFSEYQLKFNHGTIANIAFKFVDTAGLHGNASLSELLQNTGLNTNDKELDIICGNELLDQRKGNHRLKIAVQKLQVERRKISMGLGDEINIKNYKKIISEEVENILGYIPIENMGRTIKECPKSFDIYSTGDLKLSQILQSNDALTKIVEASLNIPEEWHRTPKLTIGSQIARMVMQALCVRLGVDWEMSDKKEYDEEKAKEKLKLLELNIRLCRKKTESNKLLNRYKKIEEELQEWYKIKSGFLSYKEVEKIIQNSNPQALVDKGTTAALLAKTFGGRCQNNRPTIITDKGIITDGDEDSSYGQGMRNQDKAFGRPEVMDFPITDEKYNDYPTLREWLELYKDELLPGLWHAIIDTRGYEYKHPQDFFSSWYVPSKKHSYMPYKKLLEMYSKNEENIGNLIGEKLNGEVNTFLSNGHVKIYEREIRCGVITSDGLDWLLNVPTKTQKDDILDNTLVIASMVYTASSEVKDINEYKAEISKSDGKRKFNRLKKGKIATRAIIDESPTFWFRVNLGQLIIDDLLCHRKQYPKVPRHPLNNLFKLCINTIYGVFASCFFNVSDSVVGNNITARARAYGWYFEKSCRTMGVITDGGIFNLNKVVYSASKKGRIHGSNMVNSEIVEEKSNNWKHLKLAPIFIKEDEKGNVIEHLEVNYHSKQGNTHYYSLGQDEIITEKELAKRLDNGVLLKHMQRCFPFRKIDALYKKRSQLVPVFEKDTEGKLITDKGVKKLVNENYKSYYPAESYFDWEMKGIYTNVTYHGTSNYSLWHTKKSKKPKISMRSYNERKHWDVNGNVVKEAPARQFLTSLDENIEPPKPHVKTEILKLGEYQNNIEKYADNKLAPGDSIIKTVHICPLSLSQFKFQTIEQALGWDKSKKQS